MMTPMRKRVVVVLLEIIIWITPVTAGSRMETQDAVAEAQRLRDAGEFAAAAELLRAQVAEKPEDGDAARLLAQTLYWLKDFAGARAVYEIAVVRHPEDTTLRLQYARMLAETSERARARELLKPLLGVEATQAEAGTLLGTLAYWEGDLTTARTFFEGALRENQNQEEAGRQLGEILAITAPWVRTSSGLWHDNQPFGRLTMGLEAGWFATPLTELTARVQPMGYGIDGSVRTAGVAEAAVAHYTPRARLETELAAGGVRHTLSSNGWDWTGRAGVGFRLPGHVALRVRIERGPYLSTKSSLNTPVMVRTVGGRLHWDDPKGWLGEVAYEQQRYPDDNAIRTTSGWLLAPLIHSRILGVQAGYAIAASNATASRFVLAQPNQPYLPSDPRFSTAGRYAPYYTPNHLVTHSAAAALTLGPARGATFRFGGSYAVRATDDEPFFAVSGGRALLSNRSRLFSPWEAHTSLKITLRDGLTLEPAGEIGRGAFYSWAAGSIQVTYHFMGAAKRRGGAQ
jgi:hypothetical protein